VFLHTELGNYLTKKSDDFEIEKGEIVDFCWPICNETINYKFKISYANLIRIAEKESQIIFSRVYGQKCTFKIEEKKVTTYGEHGLKYTDPEWFL